MKAKHVISDLCETLEAASTWVKFVGPTVAVIDRKPVKAATMLRRIEKALKVAYRECGYADTVRYNRALED